MDIRQTKLDNNIRVITNKMPSAMASIGAFIEAGTRNETAENNGVAHFLEHMAFKGTHNRSAQDISRQVEILGAASNAHTDYNETAYFVRGLVEHVPVAADIIGDILTHSLYDANEIKLEGGVILQEIAQYEDDAFSTMYELMDATAYPDQPLGRPILGTKEFVSNAKPEDFKQFVGENYSGKNLIVVVAGGVEHNNVVDLVSKSFCDVPCSAIHAPLVPPSYKGGVGYNRDKKFSQTNVGIRFPTVPVCDDTYISFKLLAQAFGGGMSSPLFTEIREKRGLVYHTSSSAHSEKDYGAFSLIGMMTPQNLQEFINVSCSELAKMTHSISEEDLQRAKNANLVSMALVEENTSGMMSYMAKSTFLHDRVKNFDEVRSQIELATVDDLKAAAKRLLNTKPTIALVGPVPDADYEGMVQSVLGIS